MQRDKKFSKREDMTKYGEFVCSTFHWLPIEKQKEQAERMVKITNKENDKWEGFWGQSPKSYIYQ